LNVGWPEFEIRLRAAAAFVRFGTFDFVFPLLMGAAFAVLLLLADIFV
jgi:hypothetical protein